MAYINGKKILFSSHCNVARCGHETYNGDVEIEGGNTITFSLPDGNTYTTTEGKTWEQFAKKRPDVLKQGTGDEIVTMVNDETVGTPDGSKACKYSEIIVDGTTYISMGA